MCLNKSDLGVMTSVGFEFEIKSFQNWEFPKFGIKIVYHFTFPRSCKNGNLVGIGSDLLRYTDITVSQYFRNIVIIK